MKWPIRLILFLSLTVALLPGVLVTNSSIALGETWLSGWNNRIAMAIDHTKIDSNLTNFPLLVHLSASSGSNHADITSVFNELGSDANRKKFAITSADGITQCYVEISYWSSSRQQAALWVKVPNVSSTTDTVLYLYYDHTHSDNDAYVGDTRSIPAEKVWSNYAAVYHLVESGNGTPGEYKDSTSGHHDGQGGATPGSQSPTMVFNELGLPVQHFNGVNQYIRFPDADVYSIPTSGYFIQTHNLSLDDLNPNTNDLKTSYMGKIRGDGQSAWVEWLWQYANQNHPQRPEYFNWYVGSRTGGLMATANIGEYYPIDYGYSLETNTFYHIGVICHTSNPTTGDMYAYMDGIHHGEQGEFSNYDVNYQNGPAPFCLGSQSDGFTDPNGYLKGRITEVRFANFSLSYTLPDQPYFKADSYSMKDDLLNFEVSGSQPPSLQQPTVITNAASGLTTTGATLHANLTSKGTASTVTVSFVYGLTAEYGSTVSGVPSTMTSTGAYSAVLTGLTPNTAYHYRAKAVGDGNGYGDDQTFTTANVNTTLPTPPVDDISNVGGGGGIITGSSTILTEYINDEGILLIDVVAESVDGQVILTLFEGTIANNKYGQPLRSITIEENTILLVPPGDYQLVCASYDIGPSGATFNPPALLTFQYNDSQVPEGVTENNMIFTTWQNGEWVELEGYIIDTVNNTITIQTNHLTTFAVMANISPAVFEIDALTIIPSEIYLGEMVTVNAIVTNIGGLTGSNDVILKIDDIPLHTKSLTLYGGVSEEVTFSITSDNTGEHRISIGNVSGIFSIIAPKRPAAFTVSGLKINPGSINPGENISISTLITNTGELKGSYLAELIINDIIVQTKEISLVGGQNTTVSFNIVPDKLGTYQVNIGGLLESFEVEPKPSPLFTENVVKPEPPPVFTEIAIRPEVTSFIVTPNYDQTDNQLAYATVIYQIDQIFGSLPDVRLMLTVFRNGELLEKITLCTLGELSVDGKTGELKYIPPAGWETGEYTFRAELYEGEVFLHDIISQHLAVTPESMTAMINWRTLGIAIGTMLLLAMIIPGICALLGRYYKRDIFRHDWW